MKIVYCVTHCEFPYGGLRILIIEAELLQKRGHEVEIWTLTPNPKETFGSTVKFVYVPCLWGGPDGQDLVAIYPEKADVITPDIFVIGSYPIAPAIKFVPSAKHFWYLQHDEAFACFSPNDFKLLTNALNMPITLITNSHWTQDTIKNKYNKESILLHYGLDHELFTPASPILSSEMPTAVFVYSDADWKGPMEIFFALDEVRKKIPQLKLIAISASVPKRLLYYNDIVFFIRPHQKEIASIYSSATVFVSSSWYEGFGLPGLEAMACGVPVVTSDSGGVLDYAKHEETAIVVPHKDPSALAEGVMRVLSDETLRNKLIRNGLEKVKEFDWDTHIDKLEHIFHNK